MAKINHHAALIYTMVMVSASDRDMTDAELASIGDMVLHLPVFEDFDRKKLTRVGADCAKMLQQEAGLDDALMLIKKALPKKLRETAYALACEVAAADGSASQEELRLLELIRHRLDLDRLTAAAIERGARARRQTV
jgi:tellurite resistance protein